MAPAVSTKILATKLRTARVKFNWEIGIGRTVKGQEQLGHDCSKSVQLTRNKV